MKKLVKKIALPGAILAFAMALFGGATYAYSTLTTWDETGRTHLVEVHKNLRKLANLRVVRIRVAAFYYKNNYIILLIIF
ncbi:hypothetical protein GQS40_11710|uniref:Uncharacterized protein n=1 Tax=Leuconostoc lactis TaxID=1246 RepID=A0A6L7ADE4_LEULA|nr:hypothetical protein [Leuconostoc lactis]